MKLVRTTTLLLSLLAVLNACTPKMTFVTSQTVPSASGTINVKKDKNSNYVLKVYVRNLAEPKNLTPSKSTYLVWVEGDDSVTKLGQLSPSGKALEGTLSGTSVKKPDDVFITAEDNADIQNPEGQIILTTKR